MFSLDGKLYQLSVYMYSLLIANFWFLLTSILIVTIPTSFLALISVVSDVTAPNKTTRYFRAFKKNLFLTMPIGLFNFLSLLFIQTIHHITIFDSLFVKLTIYLFILFLVSYNINLSVSFFMLEIKKINYQFFNAVFVWSILLFYRSFLLMMILGYIYSLCLYYLPLLVILLGSSMFTFLYVSMYQRAWQKLMLS